MVSNQNVETAARKGEEGRGRGQEGRWICYLVSGYSSIIAKISRALALIRDIY